MDQRPLISLAGIMEVAHGAKRIGRLSLDTSMARIWSEATIIRGLEKRTRRNNMEDETKTCFDCDFVYYSSKDDKWYCEDPREEYPIREVDPNSPTCSCFYEEE